MLLVCLGDCWECIGDQIVQCQQVICDILVVIVECIIVQVQVYVSDIISEILCFVQVVLEVLKVVADVVVELCQKFFDSMVYDIVMLEECSYLLVMLGMLFDVVNYVFIEQCGVVDVLVSIFVELMECVGSCFIDYIVVEIGKFDVVVVQVVGSVVDVVSLVDVFGVVMYIFGSFSQGLGECLEQIVGVLEIMLVCSDDQLVYYVVQVCEVIDFSVFFQKQIIEELQVFVGCGIVVEMEIV